MCVCVCVWACVIGTTVGLVLGETNLPSNEFKNVL